MVGFQHFSAGVGIPGEKADAAALAVCERFLMTAVGETEAILDSDDGDDLFRLLDLGWRDLAQADVADFSLLLHAAERAERFLERGAGIDSVELV